MVLSCDHYLLWQDAPALLVFTADMSSMWAWLCEDTPITIGEQMRIGYANAPLYGDVL